jgi:hypothetical protein
MQKLNLSFEYFDAVNAKELSLEEILAQCDAKALKKCKSNWR